MTLSHILSWAVFFHNKLAICATFSSGFLVEGQEGRNVGGLDLWRFRGGRHVAKMITNPHQRMEGRSHEGEPGERIH